MSSKYVDTVSAMQVIGAVFQKPELLDVTDKYTITDEDFVDEFHRIVFGSIYKLYELGTKNITLESINDFLSARPKSEAVYKVNKGDEWLMRVSENAQLDAFDYYYSRLKKFSLLRAYDRCGIDVSFIYDMDNIFDSQKKQLQEEMLDNSSLETIANLVDSKIDAIRIQYVDDVYENAMQAGEGIYELIEKFKEHPEVGVPLYGPLINTVTRGARLKKFYLRSAPTGVGKAIPDYTMIPTPNGWQKVGDIKVGDYLFGQNGKPTKVLAVYPQPEEKEIWKVTFSNGDVAECCGEHLWECWTQSHREWTPKIWDTQTIYNHSLTMKNGFRDSCGRGYRYKIRLNQAVEYPKACLKLDPYMMGALLGDASFRYDTRNKNLNFSSATEEIPNLISKILGDGYYPVRYSHFNYNWVFKHISNPKHSLWVEEILKDYPELWMTKSETKFIPKEYLYSSVEQRYALLQGLMDTDGSIDTKGRLTFTTVSPQLRDDFIELCRSLGFITSYLTDKRKTKYTTGECYVVHIQCKKEVKINLFRLQRKKDIAIQYVRSNRRTEHKEFIGIEKIEKTTQKTAMTCFTVDNKEHLFLMNNFITTHNTRSMIADACYIACDQIYDDNFGWIGTGVGQPALFITTEQELEEIQTMMLAFLSNVDEEHILNNQYVGDEEARIQKAAELLSNAPLYIEELPDFSLQDVEDIIKKNIREHDVKYICHDYVHTSMKILEEITKRSGGVKLREDNVLFMLSNKLKDICNTYGVFILSATQLSGDYANAETPDQNLLRGKQ